MYKGVYMYVWTWVSVFHSCMYGTRLPTLFLWRTGVFHDSAGHRSNKWRVQAAGQQHPVVDNTNNISSYIHTYIHTYIYIHTPMAHRTSSYASPRAQRPLGVPSICIKKSVKLHVYVCMHVCMYVSMFMRYDVCKGRWMNVSKYVCMCKKKCQYSCGSLCKFFHLCMYICMYACMFTRSNIRTYI